MLSTLRVALWLVPKHRLHYIPAKNARRWCANSPPHNWVQSSTGAGVVSAYYQLQSRIDILNQRIISLGGQVPPWDFSDEAHNSAIHHNNLENEIYHLRTRILELEQQVSALQASKAQTEEWGRGLEQQVSDLQASKAQTEKWGRDWQLFHQQTEQALNEREFYWKVDQHIRDSVLKTSKFRSLIDFFGAVKYNDDPDHIEAVKTQKEAAKNHPWITELKRYHLEMIKAPGNDVAYQGRPKDVNGAMTRMTEFVLQRPLTHTSKFVDWLQSNLPELARLHLRSHQDK